MYELTKMERYLRVNWLGQDPRLMKKRIYRAAVSQRLRNTAVQCITFVKGIVQTGIKTTHAVNNIFTDLCYRKRFQKH